MLSVEKSKGKATMKRFNLYDMYNARKLLQPLSELRQEDLIVSKVWAIWIARDQLKSLNDQRSPLLSSSRRCCQKLIDAINFFIPQVWEEVQGIDASTPVGLYNAHTVATAFAELETVLSNEMPDVAAYIVAQKGIYRTDDLIENADGHISAKCVQ